MIELKDKARRLTKAESAREWLAREIRIGNFTRGAALPPERELAERAGVSYMTLRKAVGALVDDGLLERNHGSGTFVCSEVSEHKVQRALGLIMPAWSAPENLDTVMHFAKACEEANWLLKVTYVRSWEDRSILDFYQACDALVLQTIDDLTLIPSYLQEKLRAPVKPVVVGNAPAEYLGRDSVHYCPDARLEVPCDRLYELGHRRIFLVDQQVRRGEGPVTIHPSLAGFGEVFRRKYPDVVYDDKIMSLEIPYFQQPHYRIRQEIRDRAAELKTFTAVICPLSFYWGVMAGLRDIGLRIPEDISVLTFGDRQEAEFYNPRPAEFSVMLKGQAFQALELILWRMENLSEPPVNYQSDVQFLEGETFALAKQNSTHGKDTII